MDLLQNTYFKLGKCTRQGDPLSACLFILVFEVIFLSMRKSKSIRGVDMCNHTFLYTAYAVDSTFFLNYELSVTETMKLFDTFSLLSSLSSEKSMLSCWYSCT